MIDFNLGDGFQEQILEFEKGFQTVHRYASSYVDMPTYSIKCNFNYNRSYKKIAGI